MKFALRVRVRVRVRVRGRGSTHLPEATSHSRTVWSCEAESR